MRKLPIAVLFDRQPFIELHMGHKILVFGLFVLILNTKENFMITSFSVLAQHMKIRNLHIIKEEKQQSTFCECGNMIYKSTILAGV